MSDHAAKCPTLDAAIAAAVGQAQSGVSKSMYPPGLEGALQNRICDPVRDEKITSRRLRYLYSLTDEDAYDDDEFMEDDD